MGDAEKSHDDKAAAAAVSTSVSFAENSLEWHTASPPPHDNFTVTPIAEDPYDYANIVEDKTTGSFHSKTYEGASA